MTSLWKDEAETLKRKAKWFWAERMGYVIAIGAAFVLGKLL